MSACSSLFRTGLKHHCPVRPVTGARPHSASARYYASIPSKTAKYPKFARQLATNAAGLSPDLYPELDPPPPQRNWTLPLPDGRLLGFAQFGDPTGYPLIFLHGLPSCRLEAWSLHKMLQRKGIRLIAPERPGYGLSTPHPGRRIADHASDILQLADALNMPKFAVLGGSGGGPYALACAKEIGKERMEAVGLLAAMGPWTVPGRGYTGGTSSPAGEAGGLITDKELKRDVRTSSWLLGRSIQLMPGAIKVLADVWLAGAKWALARPKAQEGLDKWLADLDDKYANLKGVKTCPEDALPAPIPRQHLLALFHGIFAQGPSAMIQDALLLTRDWGFDLPSITYDRVQIWHGRKDTNAPLNAMRILASQLRNVEMREYEADHFEMGAYVGEVLDGLIMEGMKTAHKQRGLS